MSPAKPAISKAKSARPESKTITRTRDPSPAPHIPLQISSAEFDKIIRQVAANASAAQQASSRPVRRQSQPAPVVHLSDESVDLLKAAVSRFAPVDSSHPPAEAETQSLTLPTDWLSLSPITSKIAPAQKTTATLMSELTSQPSDDAEAVMYDDIVEEPAAASFLIVDEAARQVDACAMLQFSTLVSPALAGNMEELTPLERRCALLVPVHETALLKDMVNRLQTTVADSVPENSVAQWQRRCDELTQRLNEFMGIDLDDGGVAQALAAELRNDASTEQH